MTANKATREEVEKLWLVASRTRNSLMGVWRLLSDIHHVNDGDRELLHSAMAILEVLQPVLDDVARVTEGLEDRLIEPSRSEDTRNPSADRLAMLFSEMNPQDQAHIMGLAMTFTNKQAKDAA